MTVTITGQALGLPVTDGVSGGDASPASGNAISGLVLSGQLSGIGGQAVSLAADVMVDPAAMKPPGIPVPGDPTAISMFTAHRVNSILHQVAHASERMQAAKAAGGDLRAYHVVHIAEHLGRALDSAHEMAAGVREHYPAEAAELEAVKDTVGLAKAVSPTAKAATFAHLTETTLHELAHADLHARAMGKDDPDGDEWGFDADHCASHLAGAVEHAGKIWVHLHDNYPAEARWLTGIADITHPLEVARQHAGDPGTISGQLDLAMSAAARAKAHQTAHDTASAHAKADERRDSRGRWATDGGDVMRLHDSLGIDRMDMPQISGLTAGDRYAPSSEMMPKFTGQLRAKGITVTHERVDPGTLKPTQTTGDLRAVRGIAGSLASGQLADTKPVLISSDNRVIDGHHQWAAHLLGRAEGSRTGSEAGEPAIRVDLPADQLMAEARRFSKEQGIGSRRTGEAANPLFRRTSIAELAGPADTLEEHTGADGSLTPERAALHKRIVDGILGGHQPQEHPVATFFGGGPAAGKSSALKATPKDSAHIDSDEIKARLPEYQRMLDAKDPRAAAYVHEESSLIAKKARDEAQRRHLNYTLDGTGDSDLEKLRAKVEGARRHGYSTEGKYVTVGTDEAVRRAKARAEATGRHVPEMFIRETHASVSDTFDKAMKAGLYDKTELYDTTGRGAPKLIAGKEPGGEFTVHDPAAYRAFLDKAKEPAGGG